MRLRSVIEVDLPDEVGQAFLQEQEQERERRKRGHPNTLLGGFYVRYRVSVPPSPWSYDVEGVLEWSEVDP